MGFSSTNAQLTSAPPYVAAAISAIVFARLSDRFYRRMPFVIIPMAIVTVAYAIILSLDGALAAKKGVAYFSIVLAVIGIYPIQAAAASWNANNIAPASRRAIGIALMNCVGNVSARSILDTPLANKLSDRRNRRFIHVPRVGKAKIPHRLWLEFGIWWQWTHRRFAARMEL